MIPNVRTLSRKIGFHESVGAEAEAICQEKRGETSKIGHLQCLVVSAKANFFRRNLRRNSGKLQLSEFENVVHSGRDIGESFAISSRNLCGCPALEAYSVQGFTPGGPVDCAFSQLGLEACSETL